jgi:hypothetical protein
MCIGGLDVGQNLLLQLVKPHMKKKKKNTFHVSVKHY